MNSWIGDRINADFNEHFPRKELIESKIDHLMEYGDNIFNAIESIENDNNNEDFVRLLHLVVDPKFDRDIFAKFIQIAATDREIRLCDIYAEIKMYCINKPKSILAQLIRNRLNDDASSLLKKEKYSNE